MMRFSAKSFAQATVAVLVGFVIGGIIAVLPVQAQGESAASGDAQRVFPTLDRAEAGAAAGYEVVAPSTLPDGYQLSGIIVVPGAATTREPTRVAQTWTNPAIPDSYLSLVQDPTLRGAGSGTPSDRGGGSTVSSSAQGDFIHHFWRDGDMGYLLIARATDQMTISTLIDIATSVR
jgi:hypothetical protein